MNESAINHDAYEVYKRVRIMIYQWRDKNHGRMPRYIFLSKDAYVLLNSFGMPSQVQTTHFMNIEIAPVGVPGIYAAIGDEF